MPAKVWGEDNDKTLSDCICVRELWSAPFSKLSGMSLAKGWKRKRASRLHFDVKEGACQGPEDLFELECLCERVHKVCKSECTAYIHVLVLTLVAVSSLYDSVLGAQWVLTKQPLCGPWSVCVCVCACVWYVWFDLSLFFSLKCVHSTSPHNIHHVTVTVLQGYKSHQVCMMCVTARWFSTAGLCFLTSQRSLHRRMDKLDPWEP